MKTHMMSHVKMRSQTTYHMLLTTFGELTMELDTLKLTLDFNNG